MAGDSPQQDGTWAGGLAAGSQLAAYRIQAQAGAGGMAVVYRADDERLGRTVALKVLAPALAADAVFRQRFIRESRAAAAVDDPHILPVYEAGQADGVLFIAMRFVSGGDLRSLAAREGPLPADRAAGFISAAASALDAAHAAGLVHRDVKPSNMLVDTRPGRPDHLYLSDFGLSKGALSSATSLTGSAEVFGTPDYLAPEQASGAAVDGRTDQYALGCVAFSLLAGVPLFERDHPMAVLLAHLSAPPPSLTQRRPDLPDAAGQVLTRALAKVPGDRYPSCGEFAAALRDALSLPPYAATAAPGHPPAQAPLPEGAGTDQALPTEGTDHPRTQTIATVGNGSRQPPAPSGQPGLAAADLGGHPVTAALTAPAAHMLGYSQQPARKRLLGPGRRRAAALLAICLAAFAVTWATVDGMAGTHKPPPTAGHTPAAAKPASTTPASTTPASTTPVSSSPARPGIDISRIATLTDPATGGPPWFSADGKTLFVEETDRSIHLWDVATGTLTATLAGPGPYVALSPDGKTLAAGDTSDGKIYLWDVATRTITATPTDPGGQGARGLAFSPDGSTLADSDANGSIHLWRTADGIGMTTMTDPGGQGGPVAFSPDGNILAVADANGKTYLWNVTDNFNLITTLAATSSQSRPVAFSSDGRTLAIPDVGDGRTELWDIATGTLIATLAEPDPAGASVSDLAFSPDGKTLTVDDGSTDKIYLWDVATHTIIATRAAPDDAGKYSTVLSPDGKTLAASDAQKGIIYLWSIVP